MEGAQEARDEAEDQARCRHTDGKARQSEDESRGRAAHAEACQIADARQYLAEYRSGQRIGHGDELAVEVSSRHRTALHEQAVGNRQIGIAAAEREQRGEESLTEERRAARQHHQCRQCKEQCKGQPDECFAQCILEEFHTIDRFIARAETADQPAEAEHRHQSSCGIVKERCRERGELAAAKQERSREHRR